MTAKDIKTAIADIEAAERAQARERANGAYAREYEDVLARMSSPYQGDGELILYDESVLDALVEAVRADTMRRAAEWL